VWQENRYDVQLVQKQLWLSTVCTITVVSCVRKPSVVCRSLSTRHARPIAVAAVPGVKPAVHEDGETCAISGEADGPSLGRAALTVAERLASNARKAVDAL
jgi:hypothetical protein